MKIKLNEITEMKFKKTINENKIKTKKKHILIKKMRIKLDIKINK
jgi:hypothetical protein